MKPAVKSLIESIRPKNVERVSVSVYAEDLMLIDAMAEKFDTSRSAVLLKMVSFATKADYLYLKETDPEALEQMIEELEADYCEQHGVNNEGQPKTDWGLDFYGIADLLTTQGE